MGGEEEVGRKQAPRMWLAWGLYTSGLPGMEIKQDQGWNRAAKTLRGAGSQEYFCESALGGEGTEEDLRPRSFFNLFRAGFLQMVHLT